MIVAEIALRAVGKAILMNEIDIAKDEPAR